MTIITSNLILNTPCLDDLAAIHDFEIRNKEHLKRWESAISKNETSLKKEVKNRLNIWIKEYKEKRSIRFLMRQKESLNKIIGFCHFTQIFLGPFQASYLGYKIDYEYEGKGLMFEALEASIRYVFEDLKLHRIMANYMPINLRSANLLNRLGFKIEGFAKNYLLINNKWEDHVLTALSKEEWLKFSKKQSHQNMTKQ
jgi:ribosomal-protein-alanine N-acetyltransferase